MAKTLPFATFKVETHVSEDDVRTLLCSAFEGGSNYWYRDLDYELAEGIDFEEFCKGGARQIAETYWHWSQLIPLVEGCALTLRDKEDTDDDEEGKLHRITREDLARGLQIFAKKYPQHLADLLSENDDADTGDCFLQCVVFGDAIYG